MNYFTATLITILSVTAMAKPSVDKTLCVSEDQTVSILVTTTTPKNGEGSSIASFKGADLKSFKEAGPKYLKGNTIGDADNYQQYQLILLENEYQTKQAVLITEDHVDRVGFENKVHTLSCQ